VPIRVPPLRERVGDIPALFRAFLDPGSRIRTLDADALRLLERHPWTGNVRELENLVRRLAVLVDHEIVTAADLDLRTPAVALPSAFDPREPRSLREVQDEYIARVVEHCGGNKTRAAAILGIDVSTIHRRERAG